MYCKKNFLMLACCVSLFPGLCYSQNYRSYRKDYLKGDIIQKAAAVGNYALSGDNSLSLEGIDFGLDIIKDLGYDNDLNIFMTACVNSLNKTKSETELKIIADKLILVFNAFSDDKVKICVLQRMEDFITDDCILLVNSFLAECIQQGRKEDDVIFSCLSLLEDNANRSSFNILFLAHVMDIWPKYTDEITQMYQKLLYLYPKDVVTLIAVLSPEQKLKAIDIIESNDNFTSGLKGDVYENIFSTLKSNALEDYRFSDVDILLELKSLDNLALLRWTRASGAATEFFSVARLQYENGIIVSSQFSNIIRDIAVISNTRETAVCLTMYLDYLNTLMDKGIHTSDEVVLAVIDSLALLGDKTAFDYLLAVGYFNYPQPIKDAAQEALSKIKW